MTMTRHDTVACDLGPTRHTASGDQTWLLPSSFVEIRAGTTISDGERVRAHVHIVDRGLVTIARKVSGSRLACVGLAAAGDLIDAAPALSDSPSDPHVELRALGPVRLLLVPVATFRVALRRRPELRLACLGQMQARLAEARLIAACNARHSLSERAAHWLLSLRHQLGSDTLPVTHESLAAILGVRRAGVTIALQALQQKGVLQQHRGGLSITDIETLRQHACRCAENAISARLSQPRLPLNQATWLDDPIHERPRAMMEAALNRHGPDALNVDLQDARRDFALRLCRSIIAQAERLLAA